MKFITTLLILILPFEIASADSMDATSKSASVQELACLNDDGALDYFDKLYDSLAKKDWIRGSILEGELEQCAKKNAMAANYVLGSWFYDFAKASEENAKYFANKGKSDYSESYRKISKEDAQKALRYLDIASKAEYPMALFVLGKVYSEGIIVTPSKIISSNYYVKASKLGFAKDNKKLGITAYERAKELNPDHPELPGLSPLVYAN